MTETAVDETSAPEVEESAPVAPTKYELMLIVSSLLSDEEIKKEVAAVKKMLGDDVVYEEIWGMRPFAYRMKGQDKGFYVVWNFMLDPAAIKEMKAALKLMPNIVRHLIMKVPADYTPMKLKDIEAGLEALAAEKAEKRNRGKSKPKAGAKKKDDKPAKKEDAPAASEDKAEKTEEAPKAEAPAEETKEEAKEEKKADKKDDKKSLDEKLEDILSDADLGL